jgi:hypothetical protein
MNATITRSLFIPLFAAMGILAPFAAQRADATIQYSNPGPFAPALPGKALASPAQVPGKEYSHDFDISAAPPGGGADPAQVIAFDGLGGTADGLDFSLPAPPFSTSGQFQVDALANAHDALFKPLLNMNARGVVFPDQSHLVFSVDHLAHTVLGAGLLPVAIPPGGPVVTSGGNAIGGAGEISYELAGTFHPPNTQGIWATQAQVNAMPLPRDVDALELWGPEPGNVPLGGDASPFGDSNKYSVDSDISTGAFVPAFSVWNYDSVAGSSPYVSHALVVSLVQSLLNEPNFNPEEIDLDALMVQDDVSEDTRFDPGDKILFSIRQVAHTFAIDGTGFQSTGSEIFWMDGASTVAAPVGGFLFHGGHLWDKAYALANMRTLVPGPDGLVAAMLDLNALEAVGVPEPASAVLVLLGLTAVGSLRRCHG